MKNKFIILIKVLFFILLLYYFNKFINTEKFLNVFNSFKLIDLIFLLLLYFIFFIFVTLRWITVIKNYTTINFFYFFKNIILGYNIAIFSSTLAVDATKFYGLNKKLDSSKTFALVIYDKFFTLFFKIIFLIFVFNYLNIINYKFHENLILIISLLIIILLFCFIKNINFILKYLLKFKLFAFLKSLDEIILNNKNITTKLIFSNLVVQLQFIIMYYYFQQCAAFDNRCGEFLGRERPSAKSVSEISIETHRSVCIRRRLFDTGGRAR